MDKAEPQANLSEKALRVIRGRFKWYHFYYLLAAFDLITISTSLYLGHRILSIYTESVASDRVWAERLVRITEMAELVSEVNVPGNDVFESLDVQSESKRLDQAILNYHYFVQKVRQDVRSNVDKADSQGLLGRLDRIDATVVSIEAEARQIFQFISSGQIDIAGQHMSAMDQHFAQTAPQITNLVRDVRSIQEKHFAEETKKALLLGRLELAVGGCIILILGGVIFYGHVLAKRMTDTEVNLKRFRAAMDISADSLFLIDREQMRFIDMNETACVSMGYSREELLKMGPQDVKPESEAKLRQSIDSIIDSPEQSGVIKTVHLRKDGSTFPIEVFLRPMETEDQTILVSSVRDISERRQAEADLEVLNHQLVDAAREAGKCEIATSVLHNVGNVLNSVNVSASLFEDKLRALGVSSLNKAIDILEQHLDDVGTYVTQDERGKHLPQFLINVSRQMALDKEEISKEIHLLIGNVNHIKTIITAQQSHASGVAGVNEMVSLAELIDDALSINEASIRQNSVQVIRKFDDIVFVNSDRQKLLQILVNLICNAKNAVCESDKEIKSITVRLWRASEDCVLIEVQDNGVGIAPEYMDNLFSYGFTTRKEGHGFGLHSAIVAAEALDGSLTAYSDGLELGARFTLELPCEVAEHSLCTT